ncbi:MAG: NTP transferase domain-containing protein [Novosphingobium sp.]
MNVLGVIIAGGASRRFGRDKADVAWDGHTLFERTVAAVGPQVAELVIAGRDHGDLLRLADRPAGVGPLGGLSAGLFHAVAAGHAAVLCVPLDVHPLPLDLRLRLGGEGPAVFDDQHMIGWWPADLAGQLDAFLAAGGRAFHDWIDQAGARRVPDPPGLINVNTPDDLARLRR